MLKIAQFLTSVLLCFCGVCHLKEKKTLAGVCNVLTGILMFFTFCLPEPTAVEEGEGAEAEAIVIE